VSVGVPQEHIGLAQLAIGQRGRQRAPVPAQRPTGAIDVVEDVVVAEPPDD
jgi:hypothetical protein